jgi:hypothetical protein
MAEDGLDRALGDGPEDEERKNERDGEDGCEAVSREM